MRKVERFEELKRICQKPDYRTVGNRMVRYFERPAALYITSLLIRTPVTANQVSSAAWIVAVAGGVCLSRGTPAWFFSGVVLMQLWYLLDHVDGQVARYRKTESLDGLFFDFMMHHGVAFIVPFSAGLAVYARRGDIGAVVAGAAAAASLSMTGMLNDCRTKAYYHALVSRGGSFRVEPAARGSAAAFLERAADRGGVLSGDRPRSYRGLSPRCAKRVFSVMHKSCEGHVVMNVWSLYAVFYLWRRDAWIGPVDSMHALLVFYAVVSSAVWIVKLAVSVKRRQISTEFEETFGAYKG